MLPSGKDLSNQQVDDFMKEFDADKSGTIGLNELHAFLRFYDSSSKTMRRKTVPGPKRMRMDGMNTEYT